MWLTADYRPVTLFSLKSALATSSGAKSLLVPSPFALRMALVDAACRSYGRPRAEALWPSLRSMGLALDPPSRLVVTNLFAKILKLRRNPALPGSADQGPMGKTIAFREYVWMEGELRLAFETDDTELQEVLANLASQINYLGKRGGFVQLSQLPQWREGLPDSYLRLDPGGPSPFVAGGVMQALDDCGATATFEKINIYSGKSMSLGKERILRNVVLPYRLVRSSRTYTLYERFES